MIKSNRFFVSFVCAGLITLYLPQGHADVYDDKTTNAAMLDEIQSQAPCSYGQRINEKALRTVANLTFAPAEIPKNIINTTNDGNIFYGVVGGFLKGTINTIGRIGTGVVDLITLPIPTKPVAYPLYVWEDFEKDTSYGSMLRSDSCPYKDDMVIASPDPAAAAKKAPAGGVIVPYRQVIDGGPTYNNQTNRKLDGVFKQQMMK